MENNGGFIEDVAGFRANLAGLLRTLSSEDEQRAYQRNVPWVDVGTELVCMWFDDLYHPDDATFRSLFSAGELRAMAEFHAAFAERQARLPSSGIATWYGHPAWQEIRRAALVALRSFEDGNAE